MKEMSFKKSIVVFSKDNSVWDSKGKLRKNVISAMLDKIVKKIFSVSNVKDGWKKIVKPGDVIGIKVNCLAGKGASTHKELVEVIINRIIDAGISENRIVIWDRLNYDLKKGGFKLKYRGSGPLCFGNDAAGYEDNVTIKGSIGSQLSKVLTRYCSAIINVPVIKDHGIVGFTGALKNYFGAINNPNKYHDNYGNPYIADLNTLDIIKNKTRITIMDGLTTQYEGGPSYIPGWSWKSNIIGISKDMVALDYVCWQLIEEKRKEKGIMSLKEAGREPVYIFTAGDKNHKLGNANPDKIDIKYV
ncbi:hypothetical protein DRQ09_06495 [candidate division KSB1 bacterium]|nr:MAG: hypothetical protein DRQ09_06495 [candidate division KSB1 bacterium]